MKVSTIVLVVLGLGVAGVVGVALYKSRQQAGEEQASRQQPAPDPMMEMLNGVVGTFGKIATDPDVQRGVVGVAQSITSGIISAFSSSSSSSASTASPTPTSVMV